MKIWILKLLLGEAFSGIEKETDTLYKKLWPKHSYYEKQSKAQIRKHLLRARYK